MNILVVGSIALDHIETPAGVLDEAVGGSATYISIAASALTDGVRVVGIVGDDFPEDHVEHFRERGIDTGGLHRAAGKTFRWGGRYHEDMNERDTLYTELGVFADFRPIIPEPWKASDIVMLGNIHPSLQQHVLEQVALPRLVVCDTMNLWIQTARESLVKTIGRVDVLILNDQEAKQLTNEREVLAAGEALLSMGPSFVVIKKGEHGAMLVAKEGLFLAPAYPVPVVKDPTGAGDSFAGGFVGYIARRGNFGFDVMKQAVIAGTSAASYCVEEFGIESMRDLDTDAVMERYRKLQEWTVF
ncbi:MAG: PfkB family carbohydrate kinase [Bacteroidota bacterium]|nr:PfkB family carbohydrate kinase [Bacteroidota bacterium]